MLYLHCTPPIDKDFLHESLTPRNTSAASTFKGKSATRSVTTPRVVLLNAQPVPTTVYRNRAVSKGFQPTSTARVRRFNLANAHSMRAHSDEDLSKLNKNKKGTIHRDYQPTLPKYCFTASTYQNVLSDSSTECQTISQLPPPRHTLMTRELPYVYRYKIQKGITSLSKMMPNRQVTSTDHIW